MYEYNNYSNNINNNNNNNSSWVEIIVCNWGALSLTLNNKSNKNNNNNSNSNNNNNNSMKLSSLSHNLQTHLFNVFSSLLFSFLFQVYSRLAW